MSLSLHLIRVCSDDFHKTYISLRNVHTYFPMRTKALACVAIALPIHVTDRSWLQGSISLAVHKDSRKTSSLRSVTVLSHVTS